MSECRPLPSFAEFAATCAANDVHIDSRIDGEIPAHGPTYAPHSLLQAITQAGDLLKREPDQVLYEGVGTIDGGQFAHTATKALATLIGGSKNRQDPSRLTYHFTSTEDYPGICHLAERFFARTILSWDGIGRHSTGDIIVDERGEAVFLRKHPDKGETTSLVLGESVYCEGLQCPPGMIVKLFTKQEVDSDDFGGRDGPVRILPIDRFTQDGQGFVSFARMSLFGLSPLERAEVITHTPDNERHKQPSLDVYERRLILSERLPRLRFLAKDAVARVVEGKIPGEDLR